MEPQSRMIDHEEEMMRSRSLEGEVPRVATADGNERSAQPRTKGRATPRLRRTTIVDGAVPPRDNFSLVLFFDFTRSSRTTFGELGGDTPD